MEPEDPTAEMLKDQVIGIFTFDEQSIEQKTPIDRTSQEELFLLLRK